MRILLRKIPGVVLKFSCKAVAMSILFVSLLEGADFKVKDVNELNAVLKNVKPGDQIILTNGEWKDAKIIFEADGTKEKPITLKAETPGEVLLTGSSILRIAGDYLIADGLSFRDGIPDKGDVIEFRKDEAKLSNHSRLTNCAIENYNPADKSTEYKWVSLYGTYNRVDHCYFRNKTNAGCLLVVWLDAEPNYHLIDSNYFAFRPVLGENGAEIIRIGTSDWSMHSSYTTVESNYFEQCNGEHEIISNKSFYNTYRHNTFVECQGALTLRHGNNCLVEGNFFFGNNVKETGGIRIIGEGHRVINNYIADTEGSNTFAALSFMNGVPDSPLNRYFQVKNAVVAFNTLVNNRTSLQIGVGKNDEVSLPPVNSTIANNIIVSKKGDLITETDEPQNFRWEGNIFYGSPLGIKDSGGIEFADPGMIKIDQVYRPANTEIIRGKAVGNYEFVTEDIEGQNRPGMKSIGCDEPSEGKKIYQPMNRANTGPGWMKNK